MHVTINEGKYCVFNIFGSFISGLFLFNSVTHMVQGICGKPHMTPFSRKSSPVLNVIWSWINIILGLAIMWGTANLRFTFSNLVAFLAGGIATSLYLANFWSNPNAKLPWHRH